VERGLANSHKGRGWEEFTDNVIRKLNSLNQPMVFLLWGRNARDKVSLLDNPNHLVLQAAHPSPLSAYNGFFGCRHFSKTNRFLKEHDLEEIDWQM
ncbi:MAG: uracil-DNA glycosylase, partial [Erysipelotrichaceae bacterium]|nr:uracil-DNA glycosylase [Erysipelotrichaceae bacterium]